MAEERDPQVVALEERDELEVLKKKAIKADGRPRKNASEKNLRRYMELKAKYEPEVRKEHPAPAIDYEPEGTLKGDWQRSRKMRRLITQDLVPRTRGIGKGGITEAEYKEAQEIIDSYRR
jgi:hypothetical protein